MPLIILDHPYLRAALDRIRDRELAPPLFRATIEAMSDFIAYEVHGAISRTLNQPSRVVIVPVLRAGLGLLPGFTRLFPDALISHLGFFRDPHTLEAVPYYRNLPQLDQDQRVIILDPMLATGHSAAAAIETVRQNGATDISLISLVCAPVGVAYIEQTHPTIQTFTVSLDQGLDERGYIVPGLGDAGDRLFGTPHGIPVTRR